MRGSSIIAVIGAFASLGVTCGREPRGDCFGFGNARVEVAVVEPYTPGSQFEYGEYLLVDLRAYTATEVPPCGSIESWGPELVFETQPSLYTSEDSCDVALASTMVAPLSIAWEEFSSFRELAVDGDFLEQAMFQANVVAQGYTELPDGCRGRYTLFLYYYVNSPTDDMYELPTPGERPKWLLTRVFEPRLNCEASFDLPEGTPLCADTWVARLLSVEPK